MDRIRSRDGKDDGTTFAEFWVQGDAAEHDRQTRNDRRVPIPERG